MKKIICWLLLGVLLTGCGGVQPKAEIKAELPLQSEATEQPKVEAKEEPAPLSEPTVQPVAEIKAELPLQGEPAAQIPDVGGYDDFVAVLSAAVIDGKENKNLSPVSVYIALAMTAEGAQGDTQAELLALLGKETAEDVRKTVEQMLKTLDLSGETGELALADSIWLGKQLEDASFHEAYLKILSESYDAEADSVYFGTQEAGERIASWIREKTRDKVDVSEDAMQFDTDTLAVLLNTVYFKDSWRMPFNEDRTERGAFQGPEGERQVQYMRRTDTGRNIVRGEGFMRYALPLNEAGTMVFVLPDEGVALESLVDSPEKIRELLTGGSETEAMVDLMVPRFGFHDRTDLEEILKSLGVRTCLAKGADFSVMTDTPTHVSRVLQESYIGVDENGVTAAAYTLVAMIKNSVTFGQETVDFHLTRPFLYAIESRDGTVLFIGTVTTPDEA